MRKTRLVILPGARCLTQMCCLLLYLSCPNIGALSREQPDLARDDLYDKSMREIYGKNSFVTGDEEICCVTGSRINCESLQSGNRNESCLSLSSDLQHKHNLYNNAFNNNCLKNDNKNLLSLADVEVNYSINIADKLNRHSGGRNLNRRVDQRRSVNNRRVQSKQRTENMLETTTMERVSNHRDLRRVGIYAERVRLNLNIGNVRENSRNVKSDQQIFLRSDKINRVRLNRNDNINRAESLKSTSNRDMNDAITRTRTVMNHEITRKTISNRREHRTERIEFNRQENRLRETAREGVFNRRAFDRKTERMELVHSVRNGDSIRSLSSDRVLEQNDLPRKIAFSKRIHSTVNSNRIPEVLNRRVLGDRTARVERTDISRLSSGMQTKPSGEFSNEYRIHQRRTISLDRAHSNQNLRSTSEMASVRRYSTRRSEVDNDRFHGNNIRTRSLDRMSDRSSDQQKTKRIEQVRLHRHSRETTPDQININNRVERTEYRSGRNTDNIRNRSFLSRFSDSRDRQRSTDQIERVRSSNRFKREIPNERSLTHLDRRTVHVKSDHSDRTRDHLLVRSFERISERRTDTRDRIRSTKSFESIRNDDSNRRDSDRRTRSAELYNSNINNGRSSSLGRVVDRSRSSSAVDRTRSNRISDASLRLSDHDHKFVGIRFTENTERQLQTKSPQSERIRSNRNLRDVSKLQVTEQRVLNRETAQRDKVRFSRTSDYSIPRSSDKLSRNNEYQRRQERTENIRSIRNINEDRTRSDSGRRQFNRQELIERVRSHRNNDPNLAKNRDRVANSRDGQERHNTNENIRSITDVRETKREIALNRRVLNRRIEPTKDARSQRNMEYNRIRSSDFTSIRTARETIRENIPNERIVHHRVERTEQTRSHRNMNNIQARSLERTFNRELQQRTNLIERVRLSRNSGNIDQAIRRIDSNRQNLNQREYQNENVRSVRYGDVNRVRTLDSVSERRDRQHRVNDLESERLNRNLDSLRTTTSIRIDGRRRNNRETASRNIENGVTRFARQNRDRIDDRINKQTRRFTEERIFARNVDENNNRISRSHNRIYINRNILSSDRDDSNNLRVRSADSQRTASPDQRRSYLQPKNSQRVRDVEQRFLRDTRFKKSSTEIHENEVRTILTRLSNQRNTIRTKRHNERLFSRRSMDIAMPRINKLFNTEQYRYEQNKEYQAQAAPIYFKNTDFVISEYENKSDNALFIGENNFRKRLSNFQEDIAVEAPKTTITDYMQSISTFVQDTFASVWKMKDETKAAIVGGAAFLLLSSSVK